jgi:hypothetical protein
VHTVWHTEALTLLVDCEWLAREAGVEPSTARAWLRGDLPICQRAARALGDAARRVGLSRRVERSRAKGRRQR